MQIPVAKTRQEAPNDLVALPHVQTPVLPGFATAALDVAILTP